MEFLLVLLLVLVVTRLAGELFRRAKQAPLIGEVLAGIILGPAVLAWVNPDPATDLGAALGVVVTFGIVFLVLSAGLEVGTEGLRRALQDRMYIIAATEFVFPFGLGYALAQGGGGGVPPPRAAGSAAPGSPLSRKPPPPSVGSPGAPRPRRGPGGTSPAS